MGSHEGCPYPDFALPGGPRCVQRGPSRRSLQRSREPCRASQAHRTSRCRPFRQQCTRTRRPRPRTERSRARDFLRRAHDSRGRGFHPRRAWGEPPACSPVARTSSCRSVRSSATPRFSWMPSTSRTSRSYRSMPMARRRSAPPSPAIRSTAMTPSSRSIRPWWTRAGSSAAPESRDARRWAATSATPGQPATPSRRSSCTAPSPTSPGPTAGAPWRWRTSAPVRRGTCSATTSCSSR